MGRVVILIVVVLVLGVMTFSLSSRFQSAAQQNTTQAVNFTKLFSENKEFQRCYTIINPAGECFPTIDVLYEDQSTVAKITNYRNPLSSYFFFSMFH